MLTKSRIAPTTHRANLRPTSPTSPLNLPKVLLESLVLIGLHSSASARLLTAFAS